MIVEVLIIFHNFFNSITCMYDEQIQGSKQNFNGIKFYFCSDGAW